MDGGLAGECESPPGGGGKPGGGGGPGSPCNLLSIVGGGDSLWPEVSSILSFESVEVVRVDSGGPSIGLLFSYEVRRPLCAIGGGGGVTSIGLLP
jgi:hypothetical protein